MTRINLVDPSELADQHLFAEWREIKHIPKSLARSLKACKGDIEALKRKIPAKFTLNKGHKFFFYDKGEFLSKRYKAICEELDKRQYKYNKAALLDDAKVFDSLPCMCNDYVPDSQAIETSRERILLRISEKPDFYKWTKTNE